MRALSSVLLPWWEEDVEEGERSDSFYGERAGVRVNNPFPLKSPLKFYVFPADYEYKVCSARRTGPFFRLPKDNPPVGVTIVRTCSNMRTGGSV
jgi:hypothetical protein